MAALLLWTSFKPDPVHSVAETCFFWADTEILLSHQLTWIIFFSHQFFKSDLFFTIGSVSTFISNHSAHICVCISLRSTWSHLQWLELSWTHLDSMNLNRTHLISLGPIWTVTVPLAVAAAEVAVVFASHSFCCSFDKTPCRSSARSFDEYSLQPPAEGP